MGTGFRKGTTGAVSHESVHQAAFMLAGLCPGLGLECIGPTVSWGSCYWQGGEPHSLSSPWASLKLMLG